MPRYLSILIATVFLTVSPILCAQPSSESIPRNINPIEENPQSIHPLYKWMGELDNDDSCKSTSNLPIPRKLKVIVSKASRTCVEKKTNNDWERASTIEVLTHHFYLLKVPISKISKQNFGASDGGDEHYANSETYFLQGNPSMIRKRVVDFWKKHAKYEIRTEEGGEISVEFERGGDLGEGHSLVCNNGKSPQCKYTIGSGD
jgi:hypothetical protein